MVLDRKGIKLFWLVEQLEMSYNIYPHLRKINNLYKIAEILNVSDKELLVSTNLNKKTNEIKRNTTKRSKCNRQLLEGGFCI
ncbi:hypothetical protein GCM10025777_07030 [Membranihabitans marinus]